MSCALCGYIVRMARPEPGASLSDRAYEDIRSRILDCAIVPGTVVSERALASELGHGIAATRSALGRLSSEGLVTSLPRVGYQVAPITLRGVAAFFETWSIIGPAYVRLAMSRLTPDQRQRILDLPRLGEVFTGAEVVEQAERLFEVLSDAVDNAVLNGLYQRLQGEMHRLFTLAYWEADASGRTRGPKPEVFSFDPDEAHDQAIAFIENARLRTIEWVTKSTSLADVALSFR